MSCFSDTIVQPTGWVKQTIYNYNEKLILSTFKVY